MDTIIEEAYKQGADAVINKAAGILQKGGLVAFPTETVYGLGANAYDKNAAKKVYEAKGRPSDNPLIVHIAGYEMLCDVAVEIPDSAHRLIDEFWPGPLTLILSKSVRVPVEVTGGLNTVAVRFPAHKTAQGLIRRCGFPIAAPSANASGRPSPTRASHVAYDLSGKIDMIIDGGACEIGLESTIVQVLGDRVCILRPGSITEDEIMSAALGHCVGNGGGGVEGLARAPGTMYRHYSPGTEITIVTGSDAAVANKIDELTAVDEKNGLRTGVLIADEVRHLYKNGRVISLGSRENPADAAAYLYKALRKMDFYSMDTAYAVAFEETGLGVAIMNRLKMAADNRVIHADDDEAYIR